MPAYWIARARVIDPDRYRRYAERVPEIVAAYGGRFLARGGAFAILEGNAEPNRFALIEFPSLDQARACFASDDYRAAAAFRRDGSGIVDIAIVEGVPS
jgi:uncharacterized protein (DUF1330 family)